MAYDFGSQTLGIKNPFKTEGKLRSVTGAVLIIGGVIPLLMVAGALKANPVYAYAYAILGFVLLAAGCRHLGVGIFQLFRYFVGRSVPTSLAYNRSRSEHDAAQAEQRVVLYDDKQLHAMLMGRKNATFLEPLGWIARLLHSVFPKLTFLPHPLRNLAQEMGSLAISFTAALISFLIVTFIVSTGLAGEKAQLLAMPVLSLALLIYLLKLWFSAGTAISSRKNTQLQKASGVSVPLLIALSILIPVVVGFGLDSVIPMSTEELAATIEKYGVFSAWKNLAILGFTMVLVVAGVLPGLLSRMHGVTPQTEVSEYRENLQESVHPNEIFINLENIVLANRRYKEIPNRIYRELDPKLKEQTDGKGSFDGELLIETQPRLAQEKGSEIKTAQKILPSILAQACVLLGYLFLSLLVLEVADAISLVRDATLRFTGGNLSEAHIIALFSIISSALMYCFAWMAFSAAGNILNNASHLFWGEMKFESMLMYVKAEGTFNESKFSTGMSIHDSTRSENVLVKSSITPWIITTRIYSSIFATSGVNNLETPRFLMGMTKNDDELKGIVGEIKDFLKKRESIASITNEADLQSASVIHQVNQQTRAHSSDANQGKITLKEDEDAAGYLRNNSGEEPNA
ncbi:hypothetical protein [Aestuariibacter sp. A3R04]|uniref:hypothetical protein n=1 Tax=Aestuariibacter sp. A3R04 TaxID=2841571 RepID=UPI001C08F666|nr:hypothetical protein [Aestuariibacter sp. A3R04]MBU3020340.1 hypothetical protein [Aestuariibacter sp. A3R04]